MAKIKRRYKVGLARRINIIFNGIHQPDLNAEFEKRIVIIGIEKDPPDKQDFKDWLAKIAKSLDDGRHIHVYNRENIAVEFKVITTGIVCDVNPFESHNIEHG